MELTVSRDRLFEQPDGTWWFVVEGIDYPCDHIRYACAEIGCMGPTPPPDDLVALAAPCQTCDDSGVVADWEGSAMDCARCADRTLTIETECETCGGTGSVEGRNIASYDACYQDADLWDGPCRDGTVLLGPFRIETPVPIVGWQGIWERRACIEVQTATTCRRWDDQAQPHDDVNLGPGPARFVGQYTVKAVPV